MTAIFTLAGQLRLVGAVLVLLGLAHLVLPSLLEWRPQFTALGPLTRRIMYTHTFFIGLTCVLFGLIPLGMTHELLTPDPIPRAVLGAECVFWGLRWCAQFVAFPPGLWQASRLHTLGYVGFSLLWTWVVAVFLLALVTG